MELDDFEKDGGKPPVKKTCSPCKRSHDGHLGAMEDYDYVGLYPSVQRDYFGFCLAGRANDPEAFDVPDMI